MLRCILWGTGKRFFENINLIRYYELKEVIQVIGVTSNEQPISDSCFGYLWNNKYEMKNCDIDLIIVMTERKLYKEICIEASELGIEDNKIISYEVLQKPNFNLERYLEIKSNIPTIFTNFCWGGTTYHSLNFSFCSPFINIWISEEDYIKILKNPKYYMEQSLLFERSDWNVKEQIQYPICKCGDVRLYCWHDTDYEIVKINWEKRKKRIKWDNLFVMVVATDKQMVEEFRKLPYQKKVCFVPFEMESEQVFSINVPKQYRHIYEYLNNIAAERISYYDILELLYNGRLKMLE